jgi:hypothetical protein
MAKYKGDEESGEYQTYAVFIGEYVDEDGKTLESFHEKELIGSPGPLKWDGDTVEADVEAVATMVKQKFLDVYTDGTIE